MYQSCDDMLRIQKKRMLTGDQVIYAQDTLDVIYKYKDLGKKRWLAQGS